MAEAMKVPLLDLKPQFAALEADIRRQIDDVLASQHFILGPKVEELEQKLAAYCNVKHALGVSSGTDAILLALWAVGVGPGDEVITTPYTFFATAGCIARLGARPVFVDVQPDSMNLDPAAAIAAMGPQTRAVLPVHLFGRCVDMAPLVEAARAHNIPVIEDAAQALGSEYRGQRAGGLGTIGCFSFFPSKNLGAFGDAGLVTTNDTALYERMKLMRAHGAQPKYFHKMVGGNFRLDALQAAVLLAKLPHLDGWTGARQRHVDAYRPVFAAAGLTAPHGPVMLPAPVAAGDRHVWNQFVIRGPRRDELMAHLKEAGVQTEIYYPRPMHLQACFAELGGREGQCPVAEACARDSLALPVYPELPTGAIAYVVDQVRAFYARR
jgi:dTDP-4-amino-4,6-dideoxygalactose transaminase